MNELTTARERFAGDFNDMRRSLQSETGGTPRCSRNSLWAVLALAVGVAVGAGIRWRQTRKD